MYCHTSASVQLASGLAFHRPRRSSQPISAVPARDGAWSRRTPEIQQSASCERALERLDLAQEAAAVGVRGPQPVDPLAAVGLDPDAVALLDGPPGGVGLLEQRAGVQREDARAGRDLLDQVDQHGRFLLPRGREREPVLAEALGHLAQHLFRAVPAHGHKGINSDRDSTDWVIPCSRCSPRPLMAARGRSRTPRSARTFPVTSSRSWSGSSTTSTTRPRSSSPATRPRPSSSGSA